MTATDNANRILLPLSSTDGLRPFLAVGRRAFREFTEILILGIVVASGDAGQDAHRARNLRRRLRQLARESELAEARIAVRTAPSFAQGVRASVLDEQPDLIAVPWTDGQQNDGLEELASRPPCDAAFIRALKPSVGRRVLLAARGGPQATLALEFALKLSRGARGGLTVLHIDRPSLDAEARRRELKLFRSLLASCQKQGKVVQRTVSTDDVRAALLAEAVEHDVIVMGAGLTRSDGPSLGELPESVARESRCSAVVVKTGTPLDPVVFSGPDTPVDVVVDRWFADNTFHCREFADLDALAAVKGRSGQRISVAVMERSNRQAVRRILDTIGAELVERHSLLDQLLAFDQEGNLLDHPGRQTNRGTKSETIGSGNGQAMWNSLRHLDGDIVCWLDGDIRNIHPRMVYGVVGPLLTQRRLQYVKGFYQRPVATDDASFSQGRAQLTELTARPLLNLFFPQLSGVVEPLGREHAIRREALNRIRLFAGNGVEVGLLIDILGKFGLRAIAQSDLESRVGEDLSVTEITSQALSVVQVILKRFDAKGSLGLAKAGESMKLILQQDDRYRLQLVEAPETELPAVPRLNNPLSAK
jgi:glucosyl-3-phosphoglycerate synthase